MDRRLSRQLLPVAVLALLLLPSVALAAVGDEQAEGGEPGGDESQAPSPMLSLDVTPVIGDGPDDGDLQLDPSTGLPTLTFSPATPPEQTAVLAFTVTNDGDATLNDVSITDDRIGTVLDAAAGTTLAPGESVTVRAPALYTFEEAATGTAGLVTTGARAAATDDGGAPVEAASTIQIVAVLATPSAGLEVVIATDDGDAVTGPAGLPTVTWSAQEAAAGATRTLAFDLVLTNTGPSTLSEMSVLVEVAGTQVPVAVDANELAAGEQLALSGSATLSPEDLTGDTANGVQLPVVAEFRGTGELGQPATATAQTPFTAVIVEPSVIAEEQADADLVVAADQETLPEAGPSGLAAVFAAAITSLLLGLVLRSRPRTAAAGRPRRR